MTDGRKNGITEQQHSAWVWTAVLALALGILPARTAQWGSMAGWASPLLALPAIWAAGKTAEKLAGGQGLADAFCRLLGGGAGRALTIIYIVWAVVLGAVQLRTAVHRLNGAAGWSLDPGLVAALLIVVAGWMTGGRPAACGRWAVLALRALLVLLGGVVLLSLSKLRAENLLPVWVEDAGSALGATWTAWGLACVGIYGGFLPLCPAVHGKKRTKTVATCLMLALVLFCIQGSLGLPLAAVVEDPFLSLTRNVGIEGTFRRTESFISAVLLLADLGLLSLLVGAASHAGVQIFHAKWFGWTSAALMWFCTVLIPQPADAQWVRLWLTPAVGLTLGFGVPLLLLVLGQIKEKKK